MVTLKQHLQKKFIVLNNITDILVFNYVYPIFTQHDEHTRLGSREQTFFTNQASVLARPTLLTNSLQAITITTK